MDAKIEPAYMLCGMETVRTIDEGIKPSSMGLDVSDIAVDGTPFMNLTSPIIASRSSIGALLRFKRNVSRFATFASNALTYSLDTGHLLESSSLYSHLTPTETHLLHGEVRLHLILLRQSKSTR
jgi:hypothetical protein